MVKCTFCGTTHVPNTLFCTECGAYLLQEQGEGTDQLDTDEIGWVGEKTEIEQDLITAEQNEPRSIHLQICSTKRIVETPLIHTLVLGRLDPANNVFPEIDLSEDSGMEQGVSRKHAQIKREGRVLVEDMGSLNGTFINGRRLAAYYPEELHHGDQLQLGKLLIDVTLH